MSLGRREVLFATGGLLAGGFTAGRAGARESASPRGTAAARPSTARASSEATAEASETASQVRSIDAEFRLSADEHRSFEFSFAGATTVSVDVVVRWGPGVDVILFEPEEYRAYLNGYRARYLASGSFFDTVNVEGSAFSLTAGDYVLVVDNTGWSDGLPEMEGESGSRPVGVDAELTATQ